VLISEKIAVSVFSYRFILFPDILVLHLALGVDCLRDAAHPFLPFHTDPLKMPLKIKIIELISKTGRDVS
jgi:hypothetical protein